MELQHQRRMLRAFWEEGIQRNKNYESIITIGMRGDGDLPMAGSRRYAANMALLEKIVADQRAIMREDVNPNLTEVPQALGALQRGAGILRQGNARPRRCDSALVRR